jgi:hypothetical protein
MANLGQSTDARETDELSSPTELDIWDDQALDDLADELLVPKPIAVVEALEASIKLAWATHQSGFADAAIRRRFANYFFRLGFFVKFKSYGVKYAAPFGYSLFDLRDNGGFSIQIHETAKTEAFHVLGVHRNAFILLSSLDEWVRNEEAFRASWAAGEPEASPLAIRPEPGDVAIVESLGTVHTVVGCLLEEFATSSYDVVKRLYDQNEGRSATLPAALVSVRDVLQRASSVSPRQRLIKNGTWQTEPLDSEIYTVANLPELGLIVTTVVVLSGSITLDVDGLQIVMSQGDTTALAPGSHYMFTAEDSGNAVVSLCEVATEFAFADLRNH